MISSLAQTVTTRGLAVHIGEKKKTSSCPYDISTDPLSCLVDTVVLHTPNDATLLSQNPPLHDFAFEKREPHHQKSARKICSAHRRTKKLTLWNGVEVFFCKLCMLFCRTTDCTRTLYLHDSDREQREGKRLTNGEKCPQLCRSHESTMDGKSLEGLPCR